MSCPKCKAPLAAVAVADGIVARACGTCSGVLYEAGDIAVPLKLIGSRPARFDCPRCRRPMETANAYDGQIEVDHCRACDVLWFDAGEIMILRKLSGVENIAGKRRSEDEAAADKAAVGAAIAGAAGAVPTPAVPSDAPASVGYLRPKEAKPVVPPEMIGTRNPDEENAPVVELDGRVYRHFQTSVPVTTFVLGEFPWIAKVGDTARMRDFIAPPFLLSQEVTATESVWSAGEYLEPEEVWTAFALPGSPPYKTGVAPAQPNPWDSSLPAVWRTFWLAAASCLGAFALAAALSAKETVYQGSFAVAASDLERSRVGDVFDVKGRTSNLEFTVDTNLDGSWAYMSMALIDAETDKALDFGRELSYYHGVDDGEAWSEGSRYETFFVPRVPAGRYYLRVEPETDAPAQLNFRVIVRRDVPLKRLPLIALALLLVPALWAGLRHGAFENTRWMESDHPRTSSGDEEDDE